MVRSTTRSLPSTSFVRRSPAALALVAGCAFAPLGAHAAILTFNPICAPFNWSSVCSAPNSCGPGNSLPLNSNNWGSPVCNGAPVFPTAGDQVVFAGNGTIDVVQQVQRITINPGVTVALIGGFTTTDASVGFLNNGTLTCNSGNQSWTGIFQNNATLTEDGGGWNRDWNSLILTNNSTINLPTSVIWSSNSGGNSITNLASGTFNKTAGGQFSTNVPFTNSGAINVSSGTFRLQNTQYTGNGGTFTTSSGGELLFENTTLALAISGTSNGSVRGSGTITTAGGPGATFNVSGNGFALNGNLVITSVMTNANVISTRPGNQSWTGGTLTNNGTWTEDNGGWNRAWNSLTFTNNGTINLPTSVAWSSNSGANVLDNNATINKTGGGAFFTNVPVRNNASATIALASGGGTFQLSGTSYSGSGQLLPQSGSEVLFTNVFFDGNGGTITGTVPSGGSIRTTGTITSPGVGATFNIQGQGITFASNFGGTNGFRNNGVARTNPGNQVWSCNSIINNGTWTEDNGGWSRSMDGVSFTNNATLNLPTSTVWAANSGSPSITNTATINKTAGGQFFTNTPFTNASTGSIIIAPGGGTFRLQNTSYSGSGQILVQGSGGEMLFENVAFDGNSGVVTGTVSPGGSIRTTGTITSPGVGATFNILGEGISFNGNFGGGNAFRNNGIARTLPGNQTWTASQIINNGTWTEDSGGWSRFFVGATFTNNATLNLPGSSVWSQSSGVNSLANAGTINKTASGTFSSGVVVNNSGLIDIASGTFAANAGLTHDASLARTVVRSGGTLSGSPFTLTQGRLEGRGAVSQATTISGAAILAPGEGTSNGTMTFFSPLTISGVLEVDISGVPSVAIDRASTNQQLTINGGTLRVVLAPTFTPILGDIYELARSNSNQRSGTFSTIDIQSRPGIVFGVTYTSSSVLLTVLSTNCDSVDFNNDTFSPDSADLDDFLAVLSGGPGACSTAPSPGCNDVDFNNDGFSPDSADLESFISRLAGGPCF